MKKMIKIAIILTIITVLILAIVNSCTRLRSYDYQPVVSYDTKSNTSQIGEMRNYYTNNNEFSVVGNILRYEQVLLISSIVLVVIFTIIFFNITPKKKG